MRLIGRIIGTVFLAFGCVSCGAGKVSAPVVYTGISDASGGIAIGTNFFAVADDEDNPIRIYRRDTGGAPIKVINLNAFLALDPGSPEADLEAVTRIGNRAYWIGSHGRNKVGKDRPNRHCFFATSIKETGQDVDLIPVGKPYKGLLIDLVNAPQLTAFNLAGASLRPPKTPGALNIEGLCATPDKQLLIGFRSPTPNRKALLVPMRNPDEVVAGKSAELGVPILLDLHGYGVRDMACWEGKYVILAGPYDGGGVCQVYLWSGGTSQPKRIKNLSLRGLTPEAIIIYPDKGLSQIQLLSDDGTRLSNGVPFKLLPPAQRQFRSVWVTP